MKRLSIYLMLGATLGVARADEAPRRLTFASAIALALGQNPEIALAQETASGADAHTSGLASHRLPTVHADFAGNEFNSPYRLPFGTLGTFTLYEQTTTATSVSVSQPLTGLAYLSELVGAAEHQAKAARGDYDRSRLDVAYHAAEAYLRVLEARAGAEIAHQSVTDIGAGLARAIQLRQADTYTDIDVLRFRSAKAASEQAALRADTAATTALSKLAMRLGLRDGAEIEIDDDLPATPPPLALDLARAQDRALAARPELASAHEKYLAADAQRVAAREQYLPDVRAVAMWNHLTGTQPFQPENEELIGVRLSWNVWDWGATHHAVVEAEHAQNRAAIEAGALVEVVKYDVRDKWLDAKTAFDSLGAAATQQQTAEEAYRLQKVRFDAGAATTTDVLDAQTDVTRARVAFAVARYDYYISLVILARAMGALPESPK
jgi:outer membrane protein TolC